MGWPASRIRTLLDNLHVTGTKISEKGIAHLKASTNLRHINMTQSALSDASVEVLSEFPRLRILNANGTKLTADGVKKLKAALPNCNIEWDEPKK